MLNEAQKEKLINHIEKLVRESIMENEYFENMFPEAKKQKKHHDSEHKDKDIDGNRNKKTAVLKWLDTAQELHSVLAYELWPDKDEDTARSEFSKKYRGHDDDGKPYHFDEDEINTLYNMRGDFIQRAGLGN